MSLKKLNLQSQNLALTIDEPDWRRMFEPYLNIDMLKEFVGDDEIISNRRASQKKLSIGGEPKKYNFLNEKPPQLQCYYFIKGLYFEYGIGITRPDPIKAFEIFQQGFEDNQDSLCAYKLAAIFSNPKNKCTVKVDKQKAMFFLVMSAVLIDIQYSSNMCDIRSDMLRLIEAYEEGLKLSDILIQKYGGDFFDFSYKKIYCLMFDYQYCHQSQSQEKYDLLLGELENQIKTFSDQFCLINVFQLLCQTNQVSNKCIKKVIEICIAAKKDCFQAVLNIILKQVQTYSKANKDHILFYNCRQIFYEMYNFIKFFERQDKNELFSIIFQINEQLFQKQDIIMKQSLHYSLIMRNRSEMFEKGLGVAMNLNLAVESINKELTMPKGNDNYYAYANYVSAKLKRKLQHQFTEQQVNQHFEKSWNQFSQRLNDPQESNTTRLVYLYYLARILQLWKLNFQECSNRFIEALQLYQKERHGFKVAKTFQFEILCIKIEKKTNSLGQSSLFYSHGITSPKGQQIPVGNAIQGGDKMSYENMSVPNLMQNSVGLNQNTSQNNLQSQQPQLQQSQGLQNSQKTNGKINGNLNNQNTLVGSKAYGFQSFKTGVGSNNISQNNSNPNQMNNNIHMNNVNNSVNSNMNPNTNSNMNPNANSNMNNSNNNMNNTLNNNINNLNNNKNNNVNSNVNSNMNSNVNSNVNNNVNSNMNINNMNISNMNNNVNNNMNNNTNNNINSNMNISNMNNNVNSNVNSNMNSDVNSNVNSNVNNNVNSNMNISNMNISNMNISNMNNNVNNNMNNNTNNNINSNMNNNINSSMNNNMNNQMNNINNINNMNNMNKMNNLSNTNNINNMNNNIGNINGNINNISNQYNMNNVNNLQIQNNSYSNNIQSYLTPQHSSRSMGNQSVLMNFLNSDHNSIQFNSGNFFPAVKKQENQNISGKDGFQSKLLSSGFNSHVINRVMQEKLTQLKQKRTFYDPKDVIVMDFLHRGTKYTTSEAVIVNLNKNSNNDSQANTSQLGDVSIISADKLSKLRSYKKHMNITIDDQQILEGEPVVFKQFIISDSHLIDDMFGFIESQEKKLLSKQSTNNQLSQTTNNITTQKQIEQVFFQQYLINVKGFSYQSISMDTIALYLFYPAQSYNLYGAMKKNLFSLLDKLLVASQICDCIYNLHASNIFQLNLKPSNILFDNKKKPYFSGWEIKKRDLIQNQEENIGEEDVDENFQINNGYTAPEVINSQQNIIQPSVIANSQISNQFATPTKNITQFSTNTFSNQNQFRVLNTHQDLSQISNRSDVWSLGMILFYLFFRIDPGEGNFCRDKRIYSGFNLVITEYAIGSNYFLDKTKEVIEEMVKYIPEQRIAISQAKDIFQRLYIELDTQIKNNHTENLNYKTTGVPNTPRGNYIQYNSANNQQKIHSAGMQSQNNLNYHYNNQSQNNHRQQVGYSLPQRNGGISPQPQNINNNNNKNNNKNIFNNNNRQLKNQFQNNNFNSNISNNSNVYC